MSTRLLLTSLVILISLALSQVSASASAVSQDLKIVGIQTLCFDDGRSVERFLVRDLTTGKVFARRPEEIPQLVERTFSTQAYSASGGLTPWPTRRLPRDLKTLDFHLNSYAV